MFAANAGTRIEHPREFSLKPRAGENSFLGFEHFRSGAGSFDYVAASLRETATGSG
jgi:hypothetical protein